MTSDASAALLAAYLGFARLLRSQEVSLLQQQGEAEAEAEVKKAAEGAAAGGEVVAAGGEAEAAKMEEDVPAVESAAVLRLLACRDGVELSYQQLRAFARRFSEESAEVAPELQKKVLGGEGAEPVPERMRRELGAALHLGLV